METFFCTEIFSSKWYPACSAAAPVGSHFARPCKHLQPSQLAGGATTLKNQPHFKLLAESGPLETKRNVFSSACVYIQQNATKPKPLSVSVALGK